MCGFRGMRRTFRFSERGLCFGHRCGQRRQIRRAGIGRGKARFDIGELGLEPRGALLVLAQGGLQLIAARGEIGERAGQFGKGFFRSGKRRIRRQDPLIGAGKPLLGLLRDRDKSFLFGIEALQRRSGIGR